MYKLKIVFMKEIDQKIIDVMRDNARISITDISKITDIPDTTIHFRLKKLKNILNYRLTLNHKKLGENYYILEIIPETYAIDSITIKKAEDLFERLRKMEGILFLVKARDSFMQIGKFFAIYVGKEKPNLDIPGIKVATISETDKLWGELALCSKN
ncbi:MAG: putative HTH-type transcriptional regulator [Candidatus Methanofastidiosum methylothiophilum]|uniref:Putative HTH-type transcriptional regulator n=1 Tax=Candidatus Methanofastidiosum methylothiophilum TaxID=1705564 RepID=A0A150IPC4_9EURY|nr:MAG: putative HTH-type transcriptional regulator [Candidatus Methanofastidiosum methylthiophilus]KYC46738.1 MAG: putative HTH-type transcriptional regulator [Candidatus Methanofastidiosum methylthiophilus]KYC49624.1 MAG: putative HTH-type transcriptional regulator [Candidatus Methanofastidiosum methylthiophilus]